MVYTSQNQQRSNLHPKEIGMKSLPESYFAARGFRETSYESLNQALMLVLEQMEPTVYGDVTREMRAVEQDVPRQGCLVLEPQPEPDPLAQTTVKYAAIVTRSLSSKAASRRLGLSPGRIRQMIGDRSLYSFLIGHRRYVPDFQFQGNRLVSNIAGVNKALPSDLHPVEVYNWYHLPNLDLYLDEDIDHTIRPLEWLKGGYDAERVVFLANRMRGRHGQTSEQTRSGQTPAPSSELGLTSQRDSATPNLSARR